MALRVAVVGCGKIADGHVEEIRKIPGASLVAVCDLEPIMARQLAVRYGVPQWFDDFDRLLATLPLDVVHITTPPQSHTPLAIRAMEAGCHVLVEKPLAPTADAARKLVDCARAHGRKLTINYWYNFEQPGLQLRRLWEDGTLGDPVHVESFFGYNLAGDFGQALLHDTNHWVHRLPGKLFHNVLDHVLNKISPILTDDDPRIDAVGYRRRAATGGPADSLGDELRISLIGSRVSAYATFSAHAKPAGHFARFYGTRNTALVDYNLRTVTLDGDLKLPSALGRLVPPFQQSWKYFAAGISNTKAFARSRFGYFAGMGELVARFYRSIQEDTAPPIEYAEILRVAGWMDRVFAQVGQLAPDERVGASV